MDLDQLTADNLQKLQAQNNPAMMDIVQKYLKLFKPAKVSVITDNPDDIQFIIRIGKFLEKLDRMDAIYSEEKYVPAAFTDCLQLLRRRLTEARQKYGRAGVLQGEI